MPKNFVEEPFSVSRKFCYRKILWIGRVSRFSRFSVENFLYHSTERCRRGTLPGFRKFLVSESFMHKRGKRYHVLVKLKKVGKGWNSNPTYCFRTLLSYPLCHGNSWNCWHVSEIIKIYDPIEIRTRTYYLRNVCPKPTAEIYFWINSWQDYTDKKKRPHYTEWIIFLPYLNMRRKIIKSETVSMKKLSNLSLFIAKCSLNSIDLHSIFMHTLNFNTKRNTGKCNTQEKYPSKLRVRYVMTMLWKIATK